MGSQEFLLSCKQKVAEYFNRKKGKDRYHTRNESGRCICCVVQQDITEP